MINANRLNTLRTAWSLPQRDKSRRVDSEPLSRAGLTSSLFVGMTTSSVNGMTEPSSSPPMSHHTADPAAQAATADTRPDQQNLHHRRFTIADRKNRSGQLLPHSIRAGCSTKLMYTAAPAKSAQQMVATNSKNAITVKVAIASPVATPVTRSPPVQTAECSFSPHRFLNFTLFRNAKQEPRTCRPGACPEPP